MRAFFLAPLLALAACVPGTTGTIAGSSSTTAAICNGIDVDKLDLAWRGYDAAIDAVNLLIDANVIVRGSAKAKAVADANDRVLRAFQTAENAHAICNSTGYLAALDYAKAALSDLRIAIGRK